MTKNMKNTLKNTLRVCIALMLCIACLAGCSNMKKENARNWPTDDTMIRLYQHETGEVTTITLEEYLCGVVAGEMDNTWPEEAL